MKDVSKSHLRHAFLLILSIITVLAAGANRLQCHNCMWENHDLIKQEASYINQLLVGPINSAAKSVFSWWYGTKDNKSMFKNIDKFGDEVCNAARGELIDVISDLSGTTLPKHCYTVTKSSNGNIYAILQMMGSEEHFKEKSIKDRLGSDTSVMIPATGCANTNGTKFAWQVCVCDENYCNGVQPRESATIMKPSVTTESSQSSSELVTTDTGLNQIAQPKEVNSESQNSIECADCFWVDDKIAAADTVFSQTVGQANDSHCSGASSNLPTRRLEARASANDGLFCFTTKAFVNGTIFAVQRMPAILQDIRDSYIRYKVQDNVVRDLEVPPEKGCIKRPIEGHPGWEIENCICYTNKCNMDESEKSHGNHIYPSIAYLFVIVLCMLC